MPSGRPGSAIVAALALTAMGLTAGAGPANAVYRPPLVPVNTYFPTFTASSVRDMAAVVRVGSEYWVNHRNGFHRQALQGSAWFGPASFDHNSYGLIVSADHTTAYLAVPGDQAIQAVTATNPAVVTPIDVGVCGPKSMAVSGTKLFYGWGCSGTGGVGVIDLTTGIAGSTSVLPAPTTGSPTIAVTTDRMLVADPDGTLLSYAFDGTNVTGEPVTVPGSGPPVSLAVSPDGTKVALATTSTVVHSYDVGTLANAKAYHLRAAPIEVRFSPDSSALGITTVTRTLPDFAPGLYVVNPATGATVVRAVLEVNGRHQTPISQTMAFTADSKRVSIFATGFLITSAATTPAAVKLKLTLTPSKRAGGTNRLTVSTGVRGLTISMEYVDWANYPHRRTHKTDSTGKVSFTFRDYGGGTVSASTNGDIGHTSTRTAPKHYRVDSAATVTLVGKHTVSNGVYRFQDENHFYANVGTTPTAEAMVVTQAKHGSRWVVEDRLRISTFQINPRVILLRGMHRNQLYRFKVSTIASTYIRSATTTSPTFSFQH